MKKNKIIILLVIAVTYVIVLLAVLIGNKKTEENAKNIVTSSFSALNFNFIKDYSLSFCHIY